MRYPKGVIYRRVGGADLILLHKLLPPLLLGNWSMDGLQKLLDSHHRCRLLSTGDLPGSPILGFAEFLIVAGECQLYNIAITEQAQGGGLGRKLLGYVLEEARNLGCECCVLEVRRSNDAAIGLYVGAGFELSGMRKGYYAPQQSGAVAEDALLYTLKF